MTEYIAFYLPQYHPIPENDKWYGKGFTEWTNVAKARRLYKGHYQPHIPADLGFYDLRVQETRREQAKLAQKYGITAFCYWNYWFGNGRQLLEKPLWDVYADKEITLPFCIGWANHSWEKKQWDNNSAHNELLMEQQYLGEEDYKRYFYTYLPIFKDDRYYKVEGRLFFIIYCPLESDEIRRFINVWRKLADIEGLPGFYFVGKDMSSRNIQKIIDVGCDAVFDDNTLNIHHEQSMITKVRLAFGRKVLGRPTVFQYKDAIKYMINDWSRDERVIPVIAPNWDHSPRSGNNAVILHDCHPKYFARLIKTANKAIAQKPEGKRQVIIKSWNEWGEGNYLEPDLKYGLGYLEAIRNSLQGSNND